MTRKETWVADLHHYLSTQTDQSFEWGRRDCALFVADAIQAMTGTDVAAEFRGRYTTAIGAARTIKQITGTGTSVEDAAHYVANKFAMEPLSTVLLAQRGDMVLLEGDEGPALGIVSLDGFNALFVTAQAMDRRPLRQCRAAWRV